MKFFTSSFVCGSGTITKMTSMLAFFKDMGDFRAGLWSRSRDGLETYERLVLVSSREKLSTSRSRLCLGHLRLVPKINFRPNCAGHLNKNELVLGTTECFTFIAACAVVTIARHINTLKTMNVKDNI